MLCLIWVLGVIDLEEVPRPRRLEVPPPVPPEIVSRAAGSPAAWKPHRPHRREPSRVTAAPPGLVDRAADPYRFWQCTGEKREKDGEEVRASGRECVRSLGRPIR
uniref:Uncharacterized protein n=1 Tax=Oryza brachyantha TaxID=4533 RepID=J3LD06_ORYBR